MPDCTCSHCINACKMTPGLFKPGEAERAAEFLGLTFDEFLREHINIDWYDGHKKYVEYLVPAKVGAEGPGEIVSFGYTFKDGNCTFLDGNDRCRIHPVKPFECKTEMCCSEVSACAKEEAVEAWNTDGGRREIERVKSILGLED